MEPDKYYVNYRDKITRVTFCVGPWEKDHAVKIMKAHQDTGFRCWLTQRKS